MALSVPRPFATKSGPYYLNVKVKTALRDTARGRTLSLPIGDSHATVTVTDKVFMSLRTKALDTAKTRFRLAVHALDQYFDALANGPQPLTRTQRVALAGDIYREAARDLDTTTVSSMRSRRPPRSSTPTSPTTSAKRRMRTRPTAQGDRPTRRRPN